MYGRPEWSWNGLSDLCAPILRWQLRGRRLIMGIPLNATRKHLSDAKGDTPPAIGLHCSTLLNMDYAKFQELGGFWALLTAGDLMWIPQATILVEHNLADESVEEEGLQLRIAVTYTSLPTLGLLIDHWFHVYIYILIYIYIFVTCGSFLASRLPPCRALNSMNRKLL